MYYIFYELVSAMYRWLHGRGSRSMHVSSVTSLRTHWFLPCAHPISMRFQRKATECMRALASKLKLIAYPYPDLSTPRLPVPKHPPINKTHSQLKLLLRQRDHPTPISLNPTLGGKQKKKKTHLRTPSHRPPSVHPRESRRLLFHRPKRRVCSVFERLGAASGIDF